MVKIMKKILTAVLSLAMVACFVPQTGMQAYAETDNQETMDVTIVKEWIAEDGLQLECLFVLYRSVNNGDKEKVNSTLKTLTSGVDWQYTFESVPKSDSNGNKYEYEVVETIYSVKEDGTTIYPGFRSEVRSSQQSDTELKFTVTNIQLQTAAIQLLPGAESVLKDTANTDDAQTVWYAEKPWRVIKYKDTGNAYIEDLNNAMTLFSSGLLATGIQFNPRAQSDSANNYNGSDLLVSVYGLYESLFSDKEKQALMNRTLAVDEYQSSPPYSTGVSGTETSGHLWPLSTAEALALPSNTFRSVDRRWWLRSPGNQFKHAAIVDINGSVLHEGFNVDLSTGVRPAFNLNLESVLFTSAAEGGKSSGDVGAGSLEQVGSNSNGEWKLTLESGHDSFKVEDVSTCDGKTVNIKYSGAVAKKGEYISAIIADEDDAVKYYGNLIEFADGDSTQGTAKVTIDGKMESTDKLYVFNEQLNGDKKTDYSSALHIIDIPSSSGHKYGPWIKLNATQHQKVCEHDKTHVIKENHKWDAGKVTKKATEKQAGTRTYTCTVCKATKTETIPKLKPQTTINKAAAKIVLDAGTKAISSGSKVTASWGAVKGASSYVIYANYCDQKKLKRIKTVSGKTTSFDITKLNGKKFNPKKNLKFYVVAYKTVKGKKVKLAKSIIAHAPGSKNSKRTNVTGVKVKKASFTLKKGKTAKIKAKLVLQKKNRKPLKHEAKFRYASSNKKVAKVSKEGKITAVGKGKCTVYVYAVSGVSKKIKVTVK